VCVEKSEMERGGFNGYRKIPNASSGKVYMYIHFLCLYITLLVIYPSRRSCFSFSHERKQNKLKIVSFCMSKISPRVILFFSCMQMKYLLFSFFFFTLDEYIIMHIEMYLHSDQLPLSNKIGCILSFQT
jgi:hypothetical protein